MFGAIPNDSSDATAAVNSAAIAKAFLYANASSTDRVVLVPAGMNFTIFKTGVENVNNVVLQIDGTLIVGNNVSNPVWNSGPNGAIQLSLSQNIEITGEGLIDGQGV